MKFYKCKHCGNIIAYIFNSGVKVMCCGEAMQEIVPNTSDGAKEKHVPAASKNGNEITVTVSSILHPMAPEHFIEWIALETKQGNQRKVLKAGMEPVAKFSIAEDDEVISVYAYCNLHGLWKN